MGKRLQIDVSEKIAQKTGDGIYVCGNSDYVIDFSFDAEWDDFPVKTARFVTGSLKTIDVVFEGNSCEVPVMSNTNHFRVGVFAGDLHTTTPAYVVAKKSILCEEGVPDAPHPDVYAQLNAKLNELADRGVYIEETVEAALKKAEQSGEFDGRRGAGILNVSCNFPHVNHADGTRSYIASYDEVIAETGVEEVLIGDILVKDSLMYTVYQPSQPYIFCREPIDITGDPGADGYSPTVTLTRLSNGVQIVVQNKDGKQMAMVYDGAGGTDEGGADVRVDGSTIILDGGILSVNTTDKVEQDNTQPITSAGVFAEVGNINALLSTI